MSLSLNEHRALVEALATPLAPVEIPLRPQELPLGCVLAEPLEARLFVPPFTNSAMDGFAVRREDIAELPCTLPVSGDVPAGATSVQPLTPGTAMRIMTGAPVPQGADTVVKVEMTDHRPGITEVPATVTFAEAPSAGANVRYKGEDVVPGTLILDEGSFLTPAAISAAVSVGYASLKVIPRPRVGIITTGTELADAGSELSQGRIPDSNGPLIAGLVEQAGGTVAVHTRCQDDPRSLLDALEAWPEVDLILSAGGISAGAYEVVRQALSGPTMSFHHVAQQPGGPQGIGSVSLGGRSVPVVCLPGNPVSVFATFHVYAAGLIRVMAGRARSTQPRTLDVVAGDSWTSPAGKTQFIAVVNDAGTVRPIHALGSKSHLVASLARAHGLALVGPEATEVRPGQTLPFIPTTGGI